MQQAGVVTLPMFAIVMDLMRDWRNTPGAATVLPWLDQYLPAYGYMCVLPVVFLFVWCSFCVYAIS
jgi:hypothetical protein